MSVFRDNPHRGPSRQPTGKPYAADGPMPAFPTDGSIYAPGRKQKGFIDPIPNVLIATLTLVAVVRGPVVVGEGYTPPKHREADQQQNFLPLTGTVAMPAGTELIADSKQRRSVGDTLQGSLGPLQMQAPISPAASCMVEGKRYSIKFDTQPLVNLQQNTLATDALSTLRSQPDWTGTRFRQRNDEAPQQNLFGTTLVPPAPVPFNLTDWPTSRKPTGKYIGDSPTLQATTLATDALSALRAQPDWNGSRYRQKNDLAPQQNLLTGTLTPAAAVPESTWFWDQPRKVLRGEGYSFRNVVALQPAGAKPFVNVDWTFKPKRRDGVIFYNGRVSGAGVAPPPTPPPFAASVSEPDRKAFRNRNKREDLQPINLTMSTLWHGGFIPDLYPEPSRRKNPGHSYQDTNRLPLSNIPNLKPPVSYDWPTPAKKPRPFSTESKIPQPIPLVALENPFGRVLLPEGKALRRFDALQPPWPLTFLFQQGAAPFVNVNWDGRNKILRAALDPQPTNVPIASLDSGSPRTVEYPEEKPKTRLKDQEPSYLGSPTTLLATPTKPVFNPQFPEGLGRRGGRGFSNFEEATNLTIMLPTGATPVDPPDPPTGSVPRVEAMEEYHPTHRVTDVHAQREFQRIEQVLQQFSGKGVRVTHVAPEKPVDGQTQIADGVNWNPLADGVKRPVWYDSATGTWKPYTPTSVLNAGFYTPTTFAVENVEGVTARQTFWQRIGSIVHVEGRVDVNPVAVALTRVGLALPVGSAMTNVQHGAGVANGDNGNVGTIQADPVNDRVELAFIPTGAGNQLWFYSYSYRILT